MQDFDVAGKKDDGFVVGGWTSAQSMPNANKAGDGFGIAMRLRNTDGT